MNKIAIIENTGKDFFKARIRLANYLKNNGYEITVIVPNDGFLTKIQEANFKVISVGKTIRGKGMINQIKFAVDLYKILNKNQFDIIHCFRMQPNIIGGVLAGLQGHKKIINHVTGLGIVFTYHSFKFKLQQIIVKFFYQLNYRLFKVNFIFQNDQDAVDLNINSNCKVIRGSSVDEFRFYPYDVSRAGTLIKEHNTIYLLFASRLLKSKGLKEIVLAVQSLNKKGEKKIILLISGSVDKENFDSFTQSEISELSKNKGIVFLGNRNDIPDLINFVDICILPTFYREGSPRFLLESMACAKPIITTNNPGCEELVDVGFNGYISKKQHIDSLKQAIKNTIDCDIEKLGINSRKRYLENFSENIVFNQISTFYKNI